LRSNGLKNDIAKKVAQLLIFGFHGTTVNDEIRELIRTDQVGGIILFSRNLGTKEEILQLTMDLQNEAKEAGHKDPLFICVDQEHGVVRRLEGGTTVFPGAMLLGATGDPELSFKTAYATGQELKALGFNWNFAPTVDVSNNPQNPIIGTRAYSDDPVEVARFGIAAMKGFQAAGIVSSLKHFPGHGDTTFDSHVALPIVPHDLKRLEEVEFLPFQQGIVGGADSIMTAHVYFPAIEEKSGWPATLSSAVITGLLREKLDFEGVVVSDNMEMDAISNGIGTPRGAVEAIKAGVDMVIVSHQPELQKAVISAITEAVEQGEISLDRLEEALERVQGLKNKYLTWEDIPTSTNLEERSAVIGREEHQRLAEEVYRKGVTIVKNDANILPLQPNNQEERTLVVYAEQLYWMLDEKKEYEYGLGDAVKEIDPSVDTIQLSNPPSDEEIENVLEQAATYPKIIVGTVTSSPCNKQQELIKRLYDLGKQLIVVATRSPYDLAYIPDVPVYIASYEASIPALQIVAKTIYGLESVEGKLPVTMPRQEI
jgi:beta-N-acetylhexosaminidase